MALRLVLTAALLGALGHASADQQCRPNVITGGYTCTSAGFGGPTTDIRPNVITGGWDIRTR